MTPRVEAWIRQAQSDLAVARLTASDGFHAQACCHACQSAEKALKGQLVACGVETRYPQDEEAPVDRFDAHDSNQALSLANDVLSFATAVLEEGRAPRPSA